MKDFSIKLSNIYQRPVFYIGIMETLLDTGALFPVVNMDKIFIEEDLQGKKVIVDTHISGFGGECKGDIYQLPMLQIGELLYPDIHVFVPQEK